MLEQHRQDLKRLLVKLDSAALPVQLTGAQVGFEDSEPNAFGACGVGHAIAGWAESTTILSGPERQASSHVEPQRL
jgi:hypothetical protein